MLFYTDTFDNVFLSCNSRTNASNGMTAAPPRTASPKSIRTAANLPASANITVHVAGNMNGNFIGKEIHTGNQDSSKTTKAEYATEDLLAMSVSDLASLKYTDVQAILKAHGQKAVGTGDDLRRRLGDWLTNERRSRCQDS